MNTIRTKKYTTIVTFCFFGIIANAQTEGVSIKSTVSPPHPSAMLDVESTNKGVLIPRVSIGNVAIASPVLSPVDGLLVYNTNASIVGGNGIGFYHWTSTPTARWEKLGGSSFWSKYPANSTSGTFDISRNSKVIICSPYLGYGAPPMPVVTTSPSYSGTVGTWYPAGNPAPVAQPAALYIQGKALFYSSYFPNIGSNGINGIRIGEDDAPDGGHWNEINCNEDIDLQFANGKAVRIGMGKIGGGTDLHVWGNVYGWGGSFAMSDSTKKDSLRLIDVSDPTFYSKLMQTETYSYKFKGDLTSSRQYGVIAQEMKRKFPFLVKEVNLKNKNSRDGSNSFSSLTVDYNGLTVLLLEALKKQNELISLQQSTINSLLQRVLVLEGQ